MNKEELSLIFEGLDENTRKLVDDQLEDFIFISNKIKELKEFPFLIYKEGDKKKQKTTAAFREYKELKSQYNDTFKILLKLLVTISASDDDNPVSDFLEAYKKEHDIS